MASPATDVTNIFQPRTEKESRRLRKGLDREPERIRLNPY